METVYSVSEAAKILGVSIKTIHAWIGQGYFPGAYKLNPLAKRSEYRVPKSDVDNILSRR